MCVLAMAWQASPRWRLVVAGNRDELHARPAAVAARWHEAPQLIAGRDLRSGGTWMGVSEYGRFAVVTNIAGHEPDPAAPSRGALVADYLTGATDAPAETLEPFNALSLITVADGAARFAANRPASFDRALDPAIYGLSNGLLDEPWPRTERLRDALRAWLAAGNAAPADLLGALGDAGDRPLGATRAGDRIDPMTLPVFIRNPVYGTRCSTVIAIDAAGDGTFVERRFDEAGDTTGESAFAFRWPG